MLYKAPALFLYSDLLSMSLDIPGDIGSALAVYGHVYLQGKSQSESFLESEQKEPYSKVQLWAIMQQSLKGVFRGWHTPPPPPQVPGGVEYKQNMMVLDFRIWTWSL